MLPKNARTVAGLLGAIRQHPPPRYLMFWGHHQRHIDQPDCSCLSQWFRASFELDGQRYRTAEHYMMAEKARLFDDQEVLARILEIETPRDAKRLGRMVRGFNDQKWVMNCFAVVVQGNVAKFTQNPELGAWLDGTGDDVLVEASPHDHVWGIGMKADDEAAQEPRRWKGQNLLGFALMEVREQLRNQR